MRTDAMTGCKGVGSVDTWAELGDALGQGLHDASVGVEEIVTSHAGLARHASWDDDQVAAGEGIAELLLTDETTHLRSSLDVAQVGSHLADTT